MLARLLADWPELQYLLQNPEHLFILAASAITAIGILWFALRSRRNYLGLPELPDASRVPLAADLAVVIPARNEQANIARVVGSLAPAPVTVVDDGSTDGTAAAATAAGASVIPAQQRPSGWLGKPNACWTGAQATHSKWLLFVDADTWYQPAFVSSLMGYTTANDLSAVSVFPRQVCISFAEKTILPYAFGLYFAGVNPVAVNNEKSAQALANGQCMLFERGCYEFLGGHRALARSVIEDVEFAALMKRHRVKLRVLRAENLASVRMYDSFASLWRGFEKNSFRFLRANPATGVRVILASIFMTSWLPLFLGLLWIQEFFWAALFFAVPVIAWWPWYSTPWNALRAPLAIYFFQAIALSAMVKNLAGAKTMWKGRPV